MSTRSGNLLHVENVLRFRVLGAFFALALLLLPGQVLSQPAPNANSVLILSSLDADGFYAARATALGLTVVNATDAEWGARTTADFATFKAIIIGDPDCGGSPPTAAVANAAVWGAAIDGPVLVIGTDEYFHSSQGGQTLATSGIGFVTSGTAGQTGAYISLSCYYEDTTPPAAVPLLAPFGVFTVEGNLDCYNDSHIVAVHPALSGSTDATLSNWSCSVHEVFRSFPSSTFLPLAIAENISGVGNLTFADGTNGVPYILASGGGVTPVLCGNGIVQAPEQCDDGNTANGDGCSSFCTLEGVTPTRTPTTVPPTATNTPPSSTPPPNVPTLSFPMLALLGLGLAGAGFLLMRRS
jgi:cysteine-rich repeat protein